MPFHWLCYMFQTSKKQENCVLYLAIAQYIPSSNGNVERDVLFHIIALTVIAQVLTFDEHPRCILDARHVLYHVLSNHLRLLLLQEIYTVTWIPYKDEHSFSLFNRICNSEDQRLVLNTKLELKTRMKEIERRGRAFTLIQL